MNNAHEIPRFDLAEEILAEQRKITQARRRPPPERAAIKRKAPTRSESLVARPATASAFAETSRSSVEPRVTSHESQILRGSGLFPEQQQTRLPRVSNEGEGTSEEWYGGQVIAEIVARDIAKKLKTQTCPERSRGS